jgi:hypothetical protein
MYSEQKAILYSMHLDISSVSAWRREQGASSCWNNASGSAPKTISVLSQMKRILSSPIAGGFLSVQFQQPARAMRNH